MAIQEATIGAIVGAALSGVLGPFLVEWYRQKKEKKKLKEKDSVAEEIQLSKKIQARLTYIRDTYKADRVWISQFHNGTYYIPTGKSIQKFSVFHEILNGDTLSTQMNFQNIPIALFSKPIEKTYLDNYLAIPDFSNPLVEDYGLKYLAHETGCKSYYVFAITTIDKKFVGMLGVEYVKHKKELTIEQLSDLEVEAATISGVLVGHPE